MALPMTLVAGVLMFSGVQASEIADGSDNHGFLSKYMPLRSGSSQSSIGDNGKFMAHHLNYIDRGGRPEASSDHNELAEELEPQKIAGKDEDKDVQKLFTNASNKLIGLSAIGVALLFFAAMVAMVRVRKRRRMQQAIAFASSGGHGIDMSIPMAAASVDNTLYLKSRGSLVRIPERGLQGSEGDMHVEIKSPFALGDHFSFGEAPPEAAPEAHVENCCESELRHVRPAMAAVFFVSTHRPRRMQTLMPVMYKDITSADSTENRSEMMDWEMVGEYGQAYKFPREVEATELTANGHAIPAAIERQHGRERLPTYGPRGAPTPQTSRRATDAPAPKFETIGACNRQLRRKAKARDAAGLRREWNTLKRHHEPNDRSWGILLDGLKRIGDADGCLKTLRLVPGGGNVVHHTIVVDALASAGQADAALKLYATASFKENTRSRHARLRALMASARNATQSGDMAKARECASTAEAVARECGDARGFQTAVACCREARDWEALLRVYDAHLASNAPVPDGLARTAALQACRLAKHGARRAHELWWSWHQDIDQGETNDRPDAFAYSAYAAAFVPRGGLQLAECRRLLKDAESHGILRKRDVARPQRVDGRAEQNMMNLFASLLEGCADRGSISDALTLVDDMDARGLAHDAGYAAAIGACAKEFCVHTSGALVQHASQRNIDLGPKAWALAIKACGADAARAERRLEACRAAGAPSPHAYAFCLFACGSSQDHRRARRVRRTAQHDGFGTNQRVMLAFVAALSRCGTPDAAANLLRYVRYDTALEPPAEVWTSSMLAAAKGNRGDDAESLYKEARRRDIDVGVRVIDSLVESLADAGDWRHAWSIARDRRSRGERPPAQTAMTHVVRAAESDGCWREALALMDDMRRDNAVFYENPLLDAAFKPGIMVWSALAGQDIGPEDPEDLRMPPEKGDWGYNGPI